MHHQLTPISGIFLSTVLGILLDRYFCLTPFIYLAGCVVAGGLGLWGIADGRRDKQRKDRQIRCLVLKFSMFLFVGCAFAVWHYLDWWYEPANSFRSRLLHPVPVIAMVELEREVRVAPQQPWHPLRRGQQNRTITAEVTIRALRQFSEDEFQWLEVSGNGTLVASLAQTEEITRKWLALPAGCCLRVQGTASPMRNADNPGGWDSAMYHWGQRRGFVLTVSDDLQAVSVTGYANRWFSQMRDSIRQIARVNLKRGLSERQFRLASAVLLGDRHHLHSEELEQFARGGIIHLVAISGLHVGVLGLGLLFPLRFFSRHHLLWYAVTLLLIWFYAVIVDLRPPVTRAAILISISIMGRICFREFHSVYCLYLAGIIILISNPSTLFDVGTQLSFIAVATLFLIQSRISPDTSPVKKLLFRRKSFGFRACVGILQSFKATIVATIAVVLVALPLTSANFHLVSVVGVLLNALLVIPVSIAIFSGFLLVLAGNLPLLYYLPAMFAETSFGLIWELNDRHGFDGIGTHWLSGPTTQWCVLFYFLLSLSFGVLPFACHYQKMFRWCLGVWVLGSLLLFPQRIGFRSTVRDFRVVFINVEHGTSVLLEVPGAGVWLYDAGSLTDFRIAGRVIADTLWRRGHSRLNGVFLSHADLDHFNAVPYLLPRFQPQRLLVSKRMKHQMFPFQPEKKTGAAIRYLAETLKEHQIKIETLTAPDRLQLGILNVDVLAPQKGYKYSSDNDASLVLRIKNSDSRVLLPGDIEKEGIEVLIDNHPVKQCDIVMVPHHGSVHSEPEWFSQWSRPRFAVVSTGHKMLPDPVVASYLEAVSRRHGKLLLTSQTGMIEFGLGPQGLEPVAQ